MASLYAWRACVAHGALRSTPQRRQEPAQRADAKAFEAGSLSTMCTYAQLNGVFGCQNPKLMRTWLRERMNFSGYVVSDQGAIHDGAAAINAGCDGE